MPASPERSARYLRESAKQAAAPDRYGIPVQRDLCARYEREAGYQHVKEYVDEGADSAKLYRPALTELRRDMQAGRFDVLVIARYDRLARDQALQNFLWYEATTVYGVGVEFADPSENFDDSAEGWLMRNVKGYVSQKHRETIRKSTQAARRARAESGKLIPGRKPLYGYAWATAKKTRLVEDAPTAEVVRRLFREVLHGASLQGLADTLTAEGVPLPTGRTGVWRHGNIRRMLRNPAYIGRYDAYHVAYEEREYRLADGTLATTRVPRERDAADPARVPLPPGVVPPLVDEETWLAVQAMLDHNRAMSARRNSDPEGTLLRGGVVVCGSCGHPIHAQRTRPGGPRQGRSGEAARHPWSYTCNTRDCPSGRLRVYADTLDAEVWALLVKEVFDPARMDDLFASWRVEREERSLDAEAQLTAVTGRAAQLDRDIARMFDRMSREDDEGIAAMYRTRLQDLRAEREHLDGLMAQARDTYRHQQDAANAATTFRTWVGHLRYALHNPAMPNSMRRSIFYAVQARVVLWRADHHPRWALLLGFDNAIERSLATGEPAPFRLRTPAGQALVAADGKGSEVADEDAAGLHAAMAALMDELDPVIAWHIKYLARGLRKPGKRLAMEREIAALRESSAVAAATAAHGEGDAPAAAAGEKAGAEESPVSIENHSIR